MSRDTKALTKIIGIVYLCVGLAASPALVMYLLYVPKSVLASKPFLIHLGTLIVIYGPCFFIAYGWIRRRKWGFYLLIAYNGLWFTYFSFAFVSRMISDSKSHLSWVVMSFLIILIFLGSLIALAFRKDVRASMLWR
ncbi:MAG: hypothetical protein DMG32_07660 [Acidobacteria bacterium]|nr:MAG: hypothetical protein DMG32_07660 [Acidobacteriota bacterium]